MKRTLTDKETNITAEIELTAEQNKVFEKPQLIWWLNSDGDILSDIPNNYSAECLQHKMRHSFGSYSKAECLERKKKADFQAEYEEYAEKCNGCKQSELEWENEEQEKHYAYWHPNLGIMYDCVQVTKFESTYFLNVEDLRHFIDRIGEPAFKKYVLGVEE
ncbi:MAG: hypothetical protein EOM59_11695 [Clostridia bacterium]|nr:hypothetical protein [Clostridia bacterium]